MLSSMGASLSFSSACLFFNPLMTQVSSSLSQQSTLLSTTSPLTASKQHSGPHPPSRQQQHSHNHSPGSTVQRNIFLTESLVEPLKMQVPSSLVSCLSQPRTFPQPSRTGQAPRKELSKSWTSLCGSTWR